jgi:Arc/MetJ family transcription regulator
VVATAPVDEHIEPALRDADRLEDIAGRSSDDATRHDLHEFVRAKLREMDPVRVSIAARMLDVDPKTVRAWADEGVLVVARREPTVGLDPERFLDVLRIVRALRADGRQRGVVDEVHQRLVDAPADDRDDDTRRGESVVGQPSFRGGGSMSQTTIDLDDDLVAEVAEAYSTNSVAETVDAALHDALRNSQRRMRALNSLRAAAKNGEFDLELLKDKRNYRGGYRP